MLQPPQLLSYQVHLQCNRQGCYPPQTALNSAKYAKNFPSRQLEDVGLMTFFVCYRRPTEKWANMAQRPFFCGPTENSEKSRPIWRDDLFFGDQH